LLTRLPQLEADLRERDRRIASHEASMTELHPRIFAVEASLPSLTPSLRLDDVQPALQTLRSRFLALGGERLRQEIRDTHSALGSAQEKRDQAQRRQADALQTAHACLRDARLADLLPTLDMASVRTALDGLAEFSLDTRTLTEERDHLIAEIGKLRGQRNALELKLSLHNTPLDVEACEIDLARLRREHSVREHAREIVAKARERIVKKIMPHTMDYMQRILPQLTSGRYMLAQLTDDYKITVLDERAGDKGEFKSKDIFSGGCRDQLSLALRLSFALATLPAERGGAPRFIFLDEPLSAFDDERADALLYLLTEGEVSQAFDQIFLISHGRVDESAFTYRIRLDGGRVTDHDLPAPEPLAVPQPALQL
jgi:DNA repair exonuclease SbcCD ATPase subunit